jgi:non-reducing end alpha-L-arabinofuranosidase
MKRTTIISVLITIPIIMLLSIFVLMHAGEQKVMAAVTGPCDIYASGGTPCVAAHSTVRALFG